MVQAETDEFLIRSLESPPNGGDVLHAYPETVPVGPELLSAEAQFLVHFLHADIHRVNTGAAVVTDISLTETRRIELRTHGNEGFSEYETHSHLQRLFTEELYGREVRFGGIIHAEEDQAKTMNAVQSDRPGYTAVFSWHIST